MAIFDNHGPFYFDKLNASSIAIYRIRHEADDAAFKALNITYERAIEMHALNLVWAFNKQGIHINRDDGGALLHATHDQIIQGTGTQSYALRDEHYIVLLTPEQRDAIVEQFHGTIETSGGGDTSKPFDHHTNLYRHVLDFPGGLPVRIIDGLPNPFDNNKEAPTLFREHFDSERDRVIGVVERLVGKVRNLVSSLDLIRGVVCNFYFGVALQAQVEELARAVYKNKGTPSAYKKKSKETERLRVEGLKFLTTSQSTNIHDSFLAIFEVPPGERNRKVIRSTYLERTEGHRAAVAILLARAKSTPPVA